MNCSVCQLENEPGYTFCSRCGAHVNRSLPLLLVIEAAFTREVIWGVSLAGLILPLGVLLAGFLVAWAIWDGVGFSSYWSLAGCAVLLPGIFLTLTIFPTFRRVRSLLFNLGVMTLLGLMVGGVIAVGIGIPGFYSSFAGNG
ncbi:MAG: zinc ribbon domain-containing protein [SAR202 cluster bacterium]|nr:zinc ribbon domain-containing protein [SAR202 cluster bacterium]